MNQTESSIMKWRSYIFMNKMNTGLMLIKMVYILLWGLRMMMSAVRLSEPHKPVQHLYAVTRTMI